MKNLITIIALVFCTCAVPSNANAQKIGHFDVDSLTKIWPAYQSMMDSLAETQITFQKQVAQMYNELLKQQNLIDSMKDKDTPLVAQLRQTQFQQMQSNYEQFIQMAERQIQELQARLSDTLYTQLDAAIKHVATANKYTYILDSSKGGQVMYGDPANDVFDLVRMELKIPVPVKKQEEAVPVIGGK